MALRPFFSYRCLTFINILIFMSINKLIYFSLDFWPSKTEFLYFCRRFFLTYTNDYNLD